MSIVVCRRFSADTKIGYGTMISTLNPLVNNCVLRKDECTQLLQLSFISKRTKGLLRFLFLHTGGVMHACYIIAYENF